VRSPLSVLAVGPVSRSSGAGFVALAGISGRGGRSRGGRSAVWSEVVAEDGVRVGVVNDRPRVVGDLPWSPFARPRGVGEAGRNGLDQLVGYVAAEFGPPAVQVLRAIAGGL